MKGHASSRRLGNHLSPETRRADDIRPISFDFCVPAARKRGTMPETPAGLTREPMERSDDRPSTNHAIPETPASAIGGQQVTYL
jgi:hypothetical protein